LPQRRPIQLLEDIHKENEGYLSLIQAEAQRTKIADSARGFSESLGYDNKPFHNEWYDLFQSYTSFILEAPRGHAKSTCGRNYMLWRIVQNPDIRIIILSSTYELAKGLAFDLKLQIEQRFHWLVEGSEKWGDKGMYVNRPTISKDPTIRVSSMEGIEPGPRADIIWGDDVVGEENSRSDLQRKKIHIKVTKVLMPMLEPNGQAFFTGTPYHFGDEYATLEREGWRLIRYKAIQDNGTALWKERYPLDCGLERNDKKNCCLKHIRITLGTPIFNDQYLCDPSGLVGRFLKLDWLEPYYDVPPGDMEIVQGIDLAISEKETADYTAIATVGYSPSLQKIYVLNLWRDQVDFPAQLKAIKAQAETYRPSAIVIETNVYQKVLATNLQQTTMLPIMGRVTVKDKVQRVMGTLSPYFENKKLVVRRDFYEFISEYLEFPDGSHDDMLDALEFAVGYIVESRWNEMAKYTGSGAQFGKPQGSIASKRKDPDRVLGGAWWLGGEKPGKKEPKK